MSVINLTHRIEKLEAIRDPFDVASMSDEELEYRLQAMHADVGTMIESLGGKETAIAKMRRDGARPAELAIIEEWPEWSQ